MNVLYFDKKKIVKQISIFCNASRINVFNLVILALITIGNLFVLSNLIETGIDSHISTI